MIERSNENLLKSLDVMANDPATLALLSPFAQIAEHAGRRIRELEEATKAAQAVNSKILMAGGLEIDSWWESLIAAQQKLGVAARK